MHAVEPDGPDSLVRPCDRTTQVWPRRRHTQHPAARGFEPTRPNTLNGNYSFTATEYLYTRGTPHGLEASVIKFLMSKPVATQLRGTSFISCSDLKGSKLSVECPSA